MAAIITENFRQHNANQFFESLNETGLDETDANNTRYYFFIGKSNSYVSADDNGSNLSNDLNPPVPADDVTTESYVWDAMTAAKRILSTDVKYVIPRRNYVNNLTTTYDMYDDSIRGVTTTDPVGNLTTNFYSNLWESDFCFITPNYRVYKVLYNDQGNPYTGTEPTSENISPFFEGNYMFKYMYTLTVSEVDRFFTTNFIPVPNDRNSAITDGDGKIHVVNITNYGSGYSGSNGIGPYYTKIRGDGTGAILKFYLTNGGAIVPFGGGATDTVVVDDPDINVENTGYTYGYVDLSSANVFTNVELTASAGFNLSVGGIAAEIKAIIPPKGGHGFNPISELGAHFVMINTQLNQAEGDDFSVSSEFRQLGIITDPENYGAPGVRCSETTRRQTYAINVNNVVGSFLVGEKIEQSNTGAIGRVVEWDSVNNILYYLQERHVGYGTPESGSKIYEYVAFEDNYTITATSGASANPNTDPNNNVNNRTKTIILPNNNTIVFEAGYCNPEMQPDSGNIIYIENRKPISRASDQTEDIKITIEF